MKYFKHLVSLVSLLFNIANSATSTCEWSGMNATYDLHPLTLTSGGQSKYYKVNDTREGNLNFIYSFNICDQVLSYPSEDCENLHKGYCPSNCINGTECECDTVNITGQAFGYQQGEKCWHLGSANDGDYEFSLLDNDNPSAGVVLTYNNGDWCSKYARNRQFNVRLECENDEYNVPDNEEVIEYECVYNLTFQSIYGCPSECGVYSHSLCASQGLCSYDWTNTKAKCFCYHGYSGYDCSSQSTDTVSPDTKDPPTASKFVHTFGWTTTLQDASGKSFDASVNVTYDLSPFNLDNEVFIVNDEDKSDFEYYFNVLSNIDSNLLPSACDDATSSCDFTNDPNCTDVTTVNSKGAAFQYNNATDKCNLAGTVDSTSDYSWSLLDPTDDPAKGVNLTYTNGGYCEEYNKNRVFSISFKCPTSTRDYYDPSEETTFSEFVDETHNDCEYSITIESALGCPYECITDVYDNKTGDLVPDQFSVCSGRGLCAADPNAGVVRCLCDAGWEGADCNTEITTSRTTINDDHTVFQVTIAIISIVAIVCCGLLVYAKMKYDSLKKNVAMQRQLLEQEDEEMEDEMNTVADKDESDDESGDDAGIGDYAPNSITDGNEMVTVDTRDKNDTNNETVDNNGGSSNRQHNDLVVEELDENSEEE